MRNGHVDHHVFYPKERKTKHQWVDMQSSHALCLAFFISGSFSLTGEELRHSNLLSHSLDEALLALPLSLHLKRPPPSADK
jgi:hypothetical protein